MLSVNDQLPVISRQYKAEDFPEDSVDEAVNYCRNPSDESKGPWCYTEGGSWEYCEIPFCPPPGEQDIIAFSDISS